MGIAYLGIGAGGALAPLIAARMQHAFGWHYALAALGILIILIAVPLPLLLREQQPERRDNNNGPAMVSTREILKSRNFYLLAFGSICSIGTIGGVGQHLKLYLRDLDFTQSAAANVMSLVLLSSLFGRILMGWLSDIMHRKHVMLLIYLITAVAIPLLLLPAFPGRVYLFAVLFGIGLGGAYMIIPLMAGDLFGVRALGRTMGIILVADGVAESAFPLLVGALYNDAAKSYALGFSVIICIAIASAVIISLLPRITKKPLA